MGFILYDLIFLFLFTLFVVVFLYNRRKNLKREGLLYLYKTKWGIKFIENTTKKYPSLLKKMEYLIIISGLFLMIGAIYFFLKISFYYITSPYLAKALKVPVIMPLIPYLPEIFKIEFLPPFYFTYWILIIAVIAIPHEFAHGIFARLNKIKILSTGFGFLGPFLAAFVEQDEKQMQKSKKFSQLSILASGTFANLVSTVFFGIILLIFFASAFAPAGVIFNSYAFTNINSSSISSAVPALFDNTTFIELKSDNKTYFIDEISYNQSLSSNEEILFAYEDTPAFRAGLSGAIAEIDGKQITSYGELNQTLLSYKPGDSITIKTISEDGKKDYKINLSENNGKAYLGIGLYKQKSSGLFSSLYNLFAKIKDPFIYYESKIGDFGIFMFDLLWWITIISFSVALVNMLPIGIFDGGRFFYLIVWGLTGKKKVGEIAFKISTWFFLLLIILMLFIWLINL